MHRTVNIGAGLRTLSLALVVAGAAPAGSAGVVHAQTAAIAGRVEDGETGNPVQGAWVSIQGTEAGQASSMSGRFFLPGVPAGEHVVEVVAAGYETARAVVTVAAGETATVQFALAPGQPALLHAPVASGAVQVQARMALVSPAMQPAGYNTESYAHLPDNDFRLVSTAPLSTFSIDVDRASYANVRRFIVQSGVRPPADAVRVEEMINYFPYSWDEASGEHPFAVTTELWNAPWEPSHRLVRIGLRARSVETAHLPPGNLVFLLDVSGSMSAPNKLPLLKRALVLLVEQLRPEDRVAVVVYSGAAGLVLSSTPGDQRAEILAAVEKLEAGGSTAGGAGIQLAYETARKHRIEGGNNRVILATDGDFNVGASSDGEMIRLIEEERESGTFLTVLGFGAGNLKDSKMEQIADHGNGNFHYVDNLLEAEKVLVEEMAGTLLTVAQDVKIQVEFNPRHVAGYRLIGYANRLLNAEDFADDAKDAGELGAGHTVTALYEVVPAGRPVPRGEVAPLRYQREAGMLPPASFEDELMYVNVRYKEPEGTQSMLLEHAVMDRRSSPSDDFRFATAVAGFGMLLRDSPHVGAYTLDDVIRLARKSRGPDDRGYRAEFVRLAETVRGMRLLEER